LGFRRGRSLDHKPYVLYFGYRLSFIAFGVGRYFSIGTLKATGKKVFLITISSRF
jgi:hypothetical protein